MPSLKSYDLRNKNQLLPGIWSIKTISGNPAVKPVRTYLGGVDINHIKVHGDQRPEQEQHHCEPKPGERQGQKDLREDGLENLINLYPVRPAVLIICTQSDWTNRRRKRAGEVPTWWCRCWPSRIKWLPAAAAPSDSSSYQTHSADRCLLGPLEG